MMPSGSARDDDALVVEAAHQHLDASVDLAQHPGGGNLAVAEDQLAGVGYGEELMAWVKLRPEASADAEELRAFCRGKIAHYKIPRYVRFVDEFPMTVTGKVQKFVMREQSIAELGLAAVAETA